MIFVAYIQIIFTIFEKNQSHKLCSTYLIYNEKKSSPAKEGAYCSNIFPFKD